MTCTATWAPEYAERLHLIESVPPNGVEPTPEQFAAFVEWSHSGEREAPAASYTTHEAPGPHGSVPVRVYRADASAGGRRPALVWIHGGAFVGGFVEMNEAHYVAGRIAAQGDVVVFSVDYRLCTDTIHHPVPHDDCYAAYRWVLQHADALGVDPARVAIGGGSAGGCLAAGVALHGRDDGVPPWQALLIYPMLHAELPEPSEQVRAALAKLPPALAEGDLTPVLQAYLGGGPELAEPYSIPGVCDDLSGFPPTLVENDEFDHLRASGERFTQQLRAAGVDVEEVTVCGVPHGHLNRLWSPAVDHSIARYVRRLTGAQ